MNTIKEITKSRGIQEILHFTTNRGLTGILAQRCVLPRSKLPEESYLEHIYKYNCQNRSRDKDWLNYINLSITEINRRLFSISHGWHSEEPIWWCILSFSPVILTHSNVYFTTTNNAYPFVCRTTGPTGLEAIFAQTIREFDNKSIYRLEGTMPNKPTCPQAEVLYPDRLDLQYLNCVYVPDHEVAARVECICDVLSIDMIDCQVNESLFPT